MKRVRFIPLTLIALIPTAAGASGISLANSWQETTLDRQQCLNRAELAVRNSGFSQNFEISGPAVFGDRDGYTAAIQCITEKGVVTFLVVGPDGKTANSWLNQLEKNF